MKYLKLSIALFVLVILAGCERTTFQDAQGESLDWDELRGQWVVVNYWAEWCKPCLEEIPELNALDETETALVLGVNFDGITGQNLQNLGEKMDIRFRLLAEDPGPQLGWKLPMGLPASYIVTPEGELLEARFGPQTKEGLLALMRE